MTASDPDPAGAAGSPPSTALGQASEGAGAFDRPPPPPTPPAAPGAASSGPTEPTSPPPASAAGPPAGGGDRPGTFAGGEAQHLHWSSPALSLIMIGRQFVLPALVLLFGSGAAFLRPLAAAVVAVVIVVRIVAWRRFTFRLADGVLVIEQGILNRTRREVPAPRIQQVDLRRRLRHRLLGVAIVRIDTAGGGTGAEATLEALADDQALALRSALLWDAGTRTTSTATTEPGTASDGGPAHAAIGSDPARSSGPAPAEASVVVHLTTRELVVAGVTGARLATALPLAGAAWGLLAELPASVSDQVADRLPTGSGALALGLVLLGPVLLAVAAATSVLTDHDFTLVRRGSDLHLRRGLLDQREATISLHRVQVVHLHENPLRRALGLCSVQLQSAGSGAGAEGEVSRVTIPSLRRDRFEALLDEVLPTAVDRPDLIAAPPAARRRAWLRRLGPVLLVTALVAVGSRSPWAALLLLLLVPAAVDAEATYRNLGHVATPTLVVARSGGLVRHTALVPVAKTQSTILAASPFQRRSGLATLHLQVAGRGGQPHIADGDAARLATLRRSALFAPAAHLDEDAVRRRLRAEVDLDPVPT